MRNLNSKGVDWSKTFLINGYFEQSLTKITKDKYPMNKIAVALIDCDLYSSTVQVLKFIQQMIKDHTILMFDDWNCFDKDDEKGQRRAFKEFLENNTQLKAQPLFSYGVYGQVFVMRMVENRL